MDAKRIETKMEGRGWRQALPDGIDSWNCGIVLHWQQLFYAGGVMKLGLIIGMLAIIPISANGQGNQDPDEVGVYFDPEAQATYADPGNFDVISAYLILTNPSASGVPQFWYNYVYFGAGYEGPAEVHGVPRGGVNDWWPMPGENTVAFFVFPNEDPLPLLAPVTVLADLTVFLNGEQAPIYLYLGENACYTMSEFTGWSDPAIIYCHSSVGSFDIPVATIGGVAPVAAKSKTWGGLKALYR